MSRYIIEGGHRLQGSVCIQGAKNSALPILAACVVGCGEHVIRNCPQLSDVDATVEILRHIGCKVRRDADCIAVDSTNVTAGSIPDLLMHEMRSSVIFLGAIAARIGDAQLSLPGGCEIGLRPIDLHLDALRKLGAVITEEGGRIHLSCPDGLHGATVALSFPSVGATENVLIAACTAKGTTTLINAAREPEISDLADFLNRCGAHISGAGEGIITVEGVRKLHAAEHCVIPDRIAAGSYMIAAAVTRGDVFVENIIPAHLGPMVGLFESFGCRIDMEGRRMHLRAPKRLKAVPAIRTMPYPGFPTDMQAPFMTACAVAEGTGVIVETVFESRFRHVPELLKLGADIFVDGRTAVIKGVPVLNGAVVGASDLRGGFALIAGGLAAQGETTVHSLRHTDRGYHALDANLRNLGARIRRINDDEEKDEKEYRAGSAGFAE